MSDDARPDQPSPGRSDLDRSNSDRPDLERQEKSNDDPDDEVAKGPSLTLLYSLIALALAAAIALAALIVRPFYLRH
jgi:hypothetical protein